MGADQKRRPYTINGTFDYYTEEEIRAASIPRVKREQHENENQDTDENELA